MVLDFSNSKSFLFRTMLYFIVTALSFRLVGTFITEQLPAMFESLLYSGGNGGFDLGFDLSSLDFVEKWISSGLSDLFSGILSVGFASAGDPSVGITVSQISTQALTQATSHPLKTVAM